MQYVNNDTGADDEDDIANHFNDPRKEAVSMWMKIKLRNSLLNRGYELDSNRSVGNNRNLSSTSPSKFFRRFSLWRKHFDLIEDEFGNGTKAYFVLIRWLMFLNLFQFVLYLFFIVVPFVVLEVDEPKCPANATNCCLVDYLNADNNGNYFLDFIQGSGYMEKTLLFQGFYRNSVYEYESIDGKTRYYNLPFFYVWTTIAYFFICLCIIVYEASQGFKVQIGDSLLTYSKLVFASWNYSIRTTEKASKRSADVRKNLEELLVNDCTETTRKKYIKSNYNKVVTIRVVVNILVVVILAAVSFGIFTAFVYSNNQLSPVDREIFHLSDVMRFVYEYLPSVVIYLSNAIIPFLFQGLIRFEQYSATFTIRLNLLRMVILRMFSLCVLYATLYAKINCVPGELECGCNDILCWETFVGQQMYKLTLTTFALQLLTTIINYLRSLVGKLNHKFAKTIGEQSFDISNHVLDVVYLQTIAWFGSYYAPLLPAIFVIVFFCMFYIKKFACLVNSVPTIHQTTETHSMFMSVILVSFMFALGPLGLSISELQPSKSCSPFKDFATTWDMVIKAFNSLPKIVQNILFFLSSTAFTLPVFIILCCIIYYKIAVISANSSRIKKLHETLLARKEDNNFIKKKKRMIHEQRRF
ncbi:PREDICTED: transmembrane channel-like protein 7 [Nicrophorus vespilloides]|uniref:Transmembrane channel-like protein 7 n=1 Tax=Nicrophorus vespilloides TaxID=110193 RepID=A0ABM1N333_NICVS|nr:PREDICTED: transmembrane channel-like protein 7 [Nicrophorus vespilloides]